MTTKVSDRIDAAMRILSLHGGFSVSDIVEITGGETSVVKRRLDELRERGLVSTALLAHPEHGKAANMYRVASGAFATPRAGAKGDPREVRRKYMWTAMRNLASFSATDVAHQGSTDEVAISINVAMAYIAQLQKGGLVIEAGRAGPDRPHMTYRLKPSANTGPKPPRAIDKGKAILDPNTGSVWRDGVRASGRIAA